MSMKYCEKHDQWFSRTYRTCFECYLDRRSGFVDCIFCGRWHSQRFDTCFACRQVSDRDEAGKFLRCLVLTRDRFTCQYCGATEGALEVDHVLPCARGGTADQWNLQVLCARCNWAKGAEFTRRDRERQVELLHAYHTYLSEYLTSDERERVDQVVDQLFQPTGDRDAGTPWTTELTIGQRREKLSNINLWPAK